MNNTGAPQGDELGQINHFDCNSAICFFISTSSFMSILHGPLEIWGVPGNKSIMNSMSRSGGIPNNYSGNTFGYSWITLIPSKEFPCTWLSRLTWSVVMTTENSTVVPFSVVNLTALLAHWMTPSYFFNQSIPRIMSIPLECKMIRFAKKSTPLW
jgi:hypothetical protein